MCSLIHTRSKASSTSEPVAHGFVHCRRSQSRYREDSQANMDKLDKKTRCSKERRKKVLSQAQLQLDASKLQQVAPAVRESRPLYCWKITCIECGAKVQEWYENKQPKKTVGMMCRICTRKSVEEWKQNAESIGRLTSTLSAHYTTVSKICEEGGEK